MEELQELANRSDLRSAERAQVRAMLEKLRRRQELTYQERQLAWAYINRYRAPNQELRSSTSTNRK